MSKFIIIAETEAEAKRVALPAEIQWMKVYAGENVAELQLVSLEEATTYTFNANEMAIREANKARFIIGDPEQVKRQIRALKQSTKLDEIMVADFYPDQQFRLKGHQLFAQLMKDLQAENR